MKSTDVYRLLRIRLGPWCKAEGFHRTSGTMLGWHRPLGHDHLVFWFQCDQHGWDPHTGSRFTLEFQRSSSPTIGEGLRNRRRFPEFLTPEELELVRALQNRVITGLHRPPPDHWSAQLEGRTREWYLAQFDPVSEPYERNQDVWLRYGSADDVSRWGDFLQPRLPRFLAEFETTSVAVPGRGV